MSAKLPFQFLVDKQNRTITVTRQFAADRLTVWDAFTRAEFLDRWWAPKPWKSRTKAMEFREGGRRLYAMVGPEGEEHYAIFTYDEIRKPEYFAGLDGFTDAEGTLKTEMPRMYWKISFADQGALTLVTVHMTTDDLKQLETIIEMGFKEGFTMALDGLDEELAGMRPRS